MFSFNSYIIEQNNLELLQDKLRSYGYNKLNMLQKTTIGVYVQKSDRELVLQDLSQKLNTEITMPVTGLKSSIGILDIITGPFAGFKIMVKPDASKSLNTDQQETLHAYFIATKFNRPNTSYSEEDIEKYGSKDVRSKYDIKDLYNISSAGWIKSASIVADTVYSKYAGEKYLIVQRSKSKFVDNISEAFKRLNSLLSVKVNQDKWNPADIWAVSPSLIDTDFSKMESLEDLNSWIDEKFQLKDLLPISLKQVKKNPKFEIKNHGVKKEKAKYKSYDLGKVSYARSLDMNVYTSKAQIVFRNFGRPENISGEILGKGAAGGKVGYGILTQFVNQYVRGTFKPLIAKDIANKYTKNKDMFLLDLYKDIPKGMIEQDFEDFKKEVKAKKNELTWVISKYQVTKLANALNSMSTLNKNKLLNNLISYAGSELDVSSVYIKISEG